MGDREKKILAGLGLAALTATGFGAAGIGPLAGLMGTTGTGLAGGGAGLAGGLTGALASGAAPTAEALASSLGGAGVGGGLGWGGLLAGAGKGAATAAGSAGANRLINPPQEVTQVIPGQLPPMSQQQDPFAFYQQLRAMGGGR